MSVRGFFKKIRLGKKGIVLPLVLTYTAVFATEISGLAEYASHTQRLVQSQQSYLQSFYLAEAASEKAVAAIEKYIATNGVAPDSGVLNTISQTPSISCSGVSYS